MDDLSLDGSQSDNSVKSFQSGGNNSILSASANNGKSRFQKKASLQLEGRSSQAVDLLLATRQAQSNSPKSKSPSISSFADKVDDSNRIDSTDNMSPVPLSKIAFKKKIVGDIFGTNGSESLAGLMYRSRIITQDALDTNKEVHQEESLLQDSLESSVSVVESDGDSEEESKHLKNMNPKQQLAVTIKNWLAFPENDEMVMEEGAVYALIALSKVDDATIRRCCASSFYKLSSRNRNREKLLQTGTAAGVVYITLQSKSVRVARLSAFTLCNLSMQQDGEATMAEENCMLALAALPAMLPSLFPICMQAMYNMTCSNDYFKKVDRIIKALLDFSSVGYDKSEYVIKALVNATRFSWLRLRLIEFGAISHLHTLLPSIPSWGEKKQELVFHMLTAIRSLSESSGCCQEMLQKGTVDILQALIKYSTDKECLLIVKVLNNFLQAPMQMSLSAFANCIHLLHTMVFRTSFTIILQYCSACLFIVTREKLRGHRDLSAKVIDAMSVLLPSTDPLTQYFAISTAGNLFFGNLIGDHSKLELLIQYFVNNGNNISDAQGKQALALALAKLSQEGDYLGVIERLGLLDKVLLLLMTLRKEHKNSLALQESCCIAVCRISLRINDGLSPELRLEVANLLLEMLEYDDKYVLSSAVSGLRAMASEGLFPKDVLHSNPFLDKIAVMVTKYGKETDLCRFGCAVLAVFSYDLEAHDLLSESSILQVLFANIRSEDAVTRELVGNTLCNLSLHPQACAKMISVNVVELLGELSSSTSEAILDLCAKCLCNLTCHKDLHREMISNNVLEILLMISLVRTVSSQTKCTCAKALLNLLTDENLMDITTSGAIRIFASLASIPFAPVQKVCSKGFHLMTMTATRRRELVKNPAVLHALFNMVKGTVCTSIRVKIRLGISIINLLACPETNFDAMKAGALSCLKIVATIGQESLRDATARLIVTLASDPKFHPMLLREPVVAMLILILQEHESVATFHVAIYGLSCLSKFDDFKKLLIRDKCIEALIGMTFQGRVTEEKVAREICATYTHLSYVYEQVDCMIQSNSFAVALGVMYSMGLTSTYEAKTLVLIMIRNISESVVARRYLVEEGIFGMLVQILLQDTQEVSGQNAPKEFDELETPCIGSLGYAAMIRIIFNLANIPALHDSLIKSGVMNLFRAMCLPIEYANPNTEEANSGHVQFTPFQDRTIAAIQEQESVASTPTAAAARSDASSLESKDNAPSPTKKKVVLNAPSDSSADSSASGIASKPSGSKEFQMGRKFLSMQAIPVGLNLKRGVNNEHEDDESDDNNSVASEGRFGHGGDAKGSRTVTFTGAKDKLVEGRMRPPLPIAPLDAGSHDHPIHISHSRLLFTYEQTNLITQCLHLLSQSSSCHESMVLQGQVMIIFRALIHADLTPLAKCEISACLAHLAQTKSCREPLVQQGAVELLIALSICSDHNTQAQCATALAYLSEITYVTKGVVASLLLLELHLEGASITHYNKEELMNLVQSHQSTSLQSRSRDPNAGNKDKDSLLRSSIGNVSSMLPSTLSPKNSAAPGENARSSLNLNSSSNLNPGAKDNASGGSSLASNGSGDTLQKILRSGQAQDGSGVKTLSTTMAELLRDLMKDKKRFDQYVEALQQSNRVNLDLNDFHAKAGGHASSHAHSGSNSSSEGGSHPGAGHQHHLSVSYNIRESISSTGSAGSAGAASSVAAGGAHHAASFSAAAPGENAANPAGATTLSSSTPVVGSKGVRAMRAGGSKDTPSRHGQENSAHHLTGHHPIPKLSKAEQDLLLRTAMHTRLYINFKPHELYLRTQEVDTLKSRFEDYMYRTPVGSKSSSDGNVSNSAGYKTEQGGLSRPLTVEIKLPGLPPDRDLDKENRHRDLISIPTNKDPLSKDFRPPEQGELARANTGEKRGTIRLSEGSSGINGLDTVDEESLTSGNNQHSPLSISSQGKMGGKNAKFGRAPSLSSIGKHSSLGEINRNKAPLDPRSPLVKSSSQIFNANK